MSYSLGNSTPNLMAIEMVLLKTVLKFVVSPFALQAT